MDRMPRFSRFLGGREDYHALRKLGEEVIFPKGAVIAEKGSVPDCCYIVVDGSIVSNDVAFSDNERIHFLNSNNSLILDANCIIGTPLSVSFVAARKSKLVRIPKPVLISAMNGDPEVSGELLNSLSYKFLSAMDQINELDCHSAYWKVCNLLFGLADMFGEPYEDKILIKEKYSQRMIATILGLNRGTVLKTIKDLKEKGIIEQIDGRYCIRDTDRLENRMNEMDVK